LYSWSTPTYETRIDDNDAEGYFNYLRLIASGGLDAPPDKVKAAFDQLFAFVYAMGNDIQIEGEHPIFTRKTLDERLQLFESKLTDLQSKVLNFENTVRRNNETIVQETQEISRTTRSNSELKDTLSSLGGDVKSLEDAMNSSNEKIAQILERIDQWLKLHTPTLHRARREYAKLDRRVKRN
jgi:gas vesicle protein